jgi:hypothetical protein
MSRTLPSLWILGGVAYTAATLILAQTFYGGGSGSKPTESTRAKDPARLAEDTIAPQPNAAPAQPNGPRAAPGAETGASAPNPGGQQGSADPTLTAPGIQSAAKQAAAASPTQSPTEHRTEWAQVAGYSAVVRSKPEASAPVLFGYPVGRPVRVLERKSGFAHVQDLGSGQLGWIKEAALAPYFGGYRERGVAAVEPPSQPKAPVFSQRPDEDLAENEFFDAPPILKKNAEQPRRYSKKRRGFAGILRRAFGRL